MGSSFNAFLDDKGETAHSLKSPDYVNTSPAYDGTAVICPNCGEEEQFVLFYRVEWSGYIQIRGWTDYSYELDPSEIDWNEYVEINVSGYSYKDDEEWEVSDYADPEQEDLDGSSAVLECQGCGHQWDEYEWQQQFNIDLGVY